MHLPLQLPWAEHLVLCVTVLWFTEMDAVSVLYFVLCESWREWRQEPCYLLLHVTLPCSLFLLAELGLYIMCHCSLYSEGHSFTKLLFILEFFFFFSTLQVCDPTVFGQHSFSSYHCGMCVYVPVRVCLSLWVQLHIDTHQSTASVDGLHLVSHLGHGVLLVQWTAASWPVSAWAFSCFCLPSPCRHAGIPDRHHHTQFICGLWVSLELRSLCCDKMLSPLSHLPILSPHWVLSLVPCIWFSFSCSVLVFSLLYPELDP